MPRPISKLSYNYLEFAHSPIHGPVVLKIGFPNPEISTEIKALAYFHDQRGSVRLLDWDLDQGALLLERILPGRDLTTIADDQEATRIAAQSMVSLRASPPGSDDFPTMEQWCEGFIRYQTSFNASSGLIPYPLFDLAAGLARELLQSPQEQYFLHGDLHHSNLLCREDGSWVAIDPKGVIGEFACEAGPYLFNPVPDLLLSPNLEGVLMRRLEILAAVTGLDKDRLAAWSFCRGVLAAIWSAEEGAQDLAYWVKISQAARVLVK